MLQEKATEASLVSRPEARKLLRLLADVDPQVLMPLAGPTGAPPIAVQRADAEMELFEERVANLEVAMRADLGLAEKVECERLAAYTTSTPRKAQRSLSAASDAGALRVVLERFHVGHLQGADYRVDGTTMSNAQARFIELGAAAVNALLVTEADKLAVLVADGLSPDDEVATLRSVVRCVESGLRDGPRHRQTPAGSRVIAWCR